MDMSAKNVMISYSWNDSAEQLALVSHLDSIDEVKVLYDRRNIGVGTQVHPGIANLLSNADVLIALLTTDAIQSKEVIEELTRAHASRIPILPIVASDVSRDSLPWFLRDTNSIEYRPKDFDAVLSHVEVAIRALVAGTTTTGRSQKMDEKSKATMVLFDKLIHGAEGFLTKIIDDTVRIQRSTLDTKRRLRQLQIYFETELDAVAESDDTEPTNKEDAPTRIGFALINRAVKTKRQALQAALKVLAARKEDTPVDEVFDEVKDTVHFLLVGEQETFLKGEKPNKAMDQEQGE
jgi:hypothetical protein